MKGVFYIKDIFEEYSENVEIDESEVFGLIHNKYYADICRRCKAHGWKIEIRRKKQFIFLIKASPIFIQ